MFTDPAVAVLLVRRRASTTRGLKLSVEMAQTVRRKSPKTCLDDERIETVLAAVTEWGSADVRRRASTKEAASMSLHGLTDVQRAWLTGSFAKVCCRVDSEEELLQIHDKALESGLEVYLITDSSRTEFHGQPTRTCLAIGPD